MFSKIHTVPQKMCAIDKDNFQSVEEKEEKKKQRQKRKNKDSKATYPPARYNYYELLLLHTTRARAYSITYPLFDNTMKEAEDLVTWMSIYLFMVIYQFCSLSYHHFGILLPKLFGPTVRKNCFSDRENF